MKFIYSLNAATVFDGNPENYFDCSTEHAERATRARKLSSHEILFDNMTIPAFPQERFLANDRKENRFINCMVKKILKAANFRGFQAKEDADALIVQKAI